MMIFIMALYLLLTNLGLLFIKLGSSQSRVEIAKGIFNISVSHQMLIGMLIYILSFIIYIYLLSKHDLTYIVPVLAGATYAIVIMFGVFFLHEKISFYQLIGIGVIFIGVILINLK